MESTNNINPYIGQRIRRERKRMGISQETLASDLDVSVNYLGELERGKRVVSLNMAEKLCRYFHLSLDYLYRGIHTDTPPVPTVRDADPHQELLHLAESCNDEEARLCLNILHPLLVNWRSANQSHKRYTQTDSSGLFFTKKH
jgi:transcriptional regulator with XRE-family HTH domain